MSSSEYDFFVLYDENRDEDIQCAQRIVEFLEGHNLSGHAHYRDDHPGQTVFNNFENALTKSRFVLVLISDGAVRDNWWERQVHTSLLHRMETNRDTIVPIYLPNLNIEDHPMSLSTLCGVHYSEDPHNDFWRKLQLVFTAP